VQVARLDEPRVGGDEVAGDEADGYSVSTVEDLEAQDIN
jgi:hypothetical protein